MDAQNPNGFCGAVQRSAYARGELIVSGQTYSLSPDWLYRWAAALKVSHQAAHRSVLEVAGQSSGVQGELPALKVAAMVQRRPLFVEEAIAAQAALAEHQSRSYQWVATD